MSEFARPLPADSIAAGGLERTVEATPEELAALARRLMIPVVQHLRCAFRLNRGHGGAVQAEGDLDAEVVQTCVVTLEDFSQPVREQFTVVFVPAGSETEDDDPDSPDQIPYDGAIDLGEAAAEQLALALDPYPRKPGVPEIAEEGGEAPGPFAALASLRGKH